MVYYAVLNEESICTHLDNRNQVLLNPPENFIQISGGKNVLWKKYEDGQWSEETYKPEPIPEQPTIEEQILVENQYQTALLEMNMMGVL